MLCSSLAGCIFEDGSTADKEEVLAVFSFGPSKNIKVGTTVGFDASSSTPGDGSLTYRWNFDTEGSIDIDATGLTASWSFDEPRPTRSPLRYRTAPQPPNDSDDERFHRKAPKLRPPKSRGTPMPRIARTRKLTKKMTSSCGFVRFEHHRPCRRKTTTGQLKLRLHQPRGDSSSQYIPKDGYLGSLI